MPDAGHDLFSTILRSLVGTSGGLHSYRIVCNEFRGLQLDLWISFPPIHEHVGSIVVMNPFVRSPGYHINGEKWEIGSKDDMITGGTLGVSENLHLIRQESTIIVIRPCLFRSRRLASRIFSLSRQLAAKSPPTYLLPRYHRANLKENNVSNAQLIPPDHRRDEVGRNNIALGGVVV